MKILYLIIFLELVILYFLHYNVENFNTSSTQNLNTSTTQIPNTSTPSLDIDSDNTPPPPTTTTITNLISGITTTTQNIDDDSIITTTTTQNNNLNLPDIDSDDEDLRKTQTTEISQRKPERESNTTSTTSKNINMNTNTNTTNNVDNTVKTNNPIKDKPESTSITKAQIKNFEEDIKNLSKDKDIHKISYTDYLNYHKDWIVPPSKPYVCAPPQKYPNTPQVEYNLQNGTPLSYLDETTVGYILPKFIYKEYK